MFIHRQRKEISTDTQGTYFIYTMERQEIQQYASNLETTLDLVRLLNKIKYDALGDKCHPFHEKQITYYCNPRRTELKRYINFTIPKKCGGERTLSAPVRGLKSILFSLNTLLQAIYEPSKYAMGFAPGRSVVDNAKVHVGQRYIYNIDLKDFFPSIDKSRVWKRLTLPPFNFTSDIAHTIAGLCTMRIVEDDKERFVLPQGAPTSPILTNAICDTLDRRLGAVAKRFGLRYSRYADDITFSSMHYVYGKDGGFINELHRIIRGQNFTINETKTRLQILGNRQEVTGLIVSDKINVAQSYIREVRTLLYIWEKYGYMAASECYMKAHKANSVCRRKGGSPLLDAVLKGKLQYLKMVKGEDDSTYTQLNNRLMKLIQNSTKGVKYATDKCANIAYLQTMSLQDFENAYSLVQYKEIPEPKHYFVSGDTERSISWSHTIPIRSLFDEKDERKELRNKYQISLCSNGTIQFYLLHKKLVAPQYTKQTQNLVAALEKELLELVSDDAFLNILGEEDKGGVLENRDSVLSESTTNALIRLSDVAKSDEDLSFALNELCDDGLDHIITAIEEIESGSPDPFADLSQDAIRAIQTEFERNRNESSTATLEVDDESVGD